MSPSLELVIWDMDGTLIKSACAVPDAFIAAAQSIGKTNYTRQDVIDLYRLGVPENVVAHMQGQPATLDTMNVFYNALQTNSVHVSAYDGMSICLAAIKKQAKQAVFTGASQRSAQILLKSVGINEHFDLILGGDEHPPKPDPSALLALAVQFAVKPQHCVYIGDAVTDIQAANSAGMVSVAAGWGHLYTADMGALHIANTPSHLCLLLGMEKG